MKKHRSITVMMWPIILAVVAIAATVSTIPNFSTSQRIARAEVGK